MPLPDGTRLATRIWRPAEEGPHPVLMMRQPYGREIASTITLAHPSWYAQRGYIVVVQDVRGTGGSEGDFDPFATESEDGAAAVAWARMLPGASGKIGLYGFSYQGMTQHLALAGGARVDAIAPIMSAWDLWDHFVAEGGAFRLDWNVGWAMQLGANAARRAGDGESFADFVRSTERGIGDARPALPDIALARREATHLADWVEAIGDREYWAARSPSRLISDNSDALTTPALHVGGWFDTFLEGTIAAHAAFAAAGAPARLVIGPWAHSPWQGGELSVDMLVADWFDRLLAGTPRGADNASEMRLWDLTRKEWRHLDSWPETSLPFWLTGDGLAAAFSNGLLLRSPDHADGIETFVHDPWRPVPARGHHLTAPYGMAERSDLDARADVAVFTSQPQTEPVRLTGAGRLELHVESDAPSFDLHAVLSIVDPAGSARTLTVGHQRCARPVGRQEIRLRPVCATIERGMRLRLSLSGAAWPAFAVNPGTGALPETTAGHLRRPITISISTPAKLDLGVSR
ncbi:CocE/NonD family hydrolase [Salinarimonas ramus]|uniref:Alpha/beta hydrolase n=1 Tax=Salinarimonas ramus TaxID=690164 RepID=A0A917QFM7_9HYPH|nr:CocE/NonD family hydrolase [Salinarimonas ramus]GGK47616.1 alpha/beta hydrolase [Salinarimonas ramus]